MVGPVTLENDPTSRYPQNFREEFFILALLAPFVLPMDKPAWATKTLWWVKQLGGKTVEPVLGVL